MNLQWIATHRKALVALLGAVAEVITLTGTHAPWALAIVGVATAFGVSAVPNAPQTATKPAAGPHP